MVVDDMVTGHTVPPVAGKPVPESVDNDSEAPEPAVDGDAIGSAIAMGNSRVCVVLFTGFLNFRKSLETNETQHEEKNHKIRLIQPVYRPPTTNF